MKYILFWMAIFMYSMSVNLQAAESPRIPCYVINETWPGKTMLLGKVAYRGQQSEKISLLVDGTTVESKRIEYCIDLPFGRITEFDLILSHCNKETGICDAEATLASSLKFKPRAPLKEISLELVPGEILTHLVYNSPPIFQDEKEDR